MTVRLFYNNFEVAKAKTEDNITPSAIYSRFPGIKAIRRFDPPPLLDILDNSSVLLDGKYRMFGNLEPVPERPIIWNKDASVQQQQQPKNKRRAPALSPAVPSPKKPVPASTTELTPPEVSSAIQQAPAAIATYNVTPPTEKEAFAEWMRKRCRDVGCPGVHSPVPADQRCSFCATKGNRRKCNNDCIGRLHFEAESKINEEETPVLCRCHHPELAVILAHHGISSEASLAALSSTLKERVATAISLTTLRMDKLAALERVFADIPPAAAAVVVVVVDDDASAAAPAAKPAAKPAPPLLPLPLPLRLLL